MLCIKDTTVRSAHFIASGKHDPHFIVSGKESEGVSHLNMSDSLRPHQASLSMGLSRQEYWSGLPFPSPGDLLIQGWNQGLLHCRQTPCHLTTRKALASRGPRSHLEGEDT